MTPTPPALARMGVKPDVPESVHRTKTYTKSVNGKVINIQVTKLGNKPPKAKPAKES